MPFTAYATVKDLADWLGTAPDDSATRNLRSASVRVAQACNRNPYTDQPTAADAAALRDATCAQAAAWIALGMDPNAAGLDQERVKSTSLLSGRVEYETTGQLTAQQAAANDLAPEARDILQAAGLLFQPGPGFGDDAAALSHWGLTGPWPWPVEGFETAQATDAWGDVFDEEREIVIEKPGG